MKNQLRANLLQGIKDLHIKILQSESITEIGHYLQEVLDTVSEVPPGYSEKLWSKYWKGVTKHQIFSMLKTDIKSILDGTYSRLEIAKHKATLDIAWLKGLFTDPLVQ
jgi:hypothetical protein